MFHNPVVRRQLLLVFLVVVGLTWQGRKLVLYDLTVRPRDTVQWWLQGQALREGGDLYAPLTDLGERYLPGVRIEYPHPSPYPPVFALAALPLSSLPYPLVPVVWLILSYALLLLIGGRLGLSLGSSLALAAWPHLLAVLEIGQVEVLLLVLVLAGWQAARRGEDARAGLWLGLAAAFKLYPTLFLLPFLVRGRWRLVVTAAAVGGTAQAINLALVGPTTLWHFYTSVLPTISAYWVDTWINASAYRSMLHLFAGGAPIPLLEIPQMAPLLDIPGLVLPLTLLCGVVGLLALLRLEPEAAPAAMMLVLPTAWNYHFVIALPWLLERWTVGGWMNRLALGAASVGPPLNGAGLVLLIRAAGYQDRLVPGMFAIPPAIQAVGVVALLLLALAGGTFDRQRSFASAPAE